MSTLTPKLKLYKAKFDNPNSDPVDVLRDVNLNMDILDDNANMSSRSVGVLPPVSESYTGRNIYWASSGQAETYDPSHPEIPDDWWESQANAQYMLVRNLEISDLNVLNNTNKVVRFSQTGSDQFPASAPYGITLSANKDRFTVNQVGLYIAGFTLRYSTLPSGTYEVYAGLRYKNSFGTEVRQWGKGRATGNLPVTVSASGLFKIGANDLGSWVEVVAYQNSGATQTLNNAGNLFNSFWIARLGFNGSQIL